MSKTLPTINNIKLLFSSSQHRPHTGARRTLYGNLQRGTLRQVRATAPVTTRTAHLQRRRQLTHPAVVAAAAEASRWAAAATAHSNERPPGGRRYPQLDLGRASAEEQKEEAHYSDPCAAPQGGLHCTSSSSSSSAPWSARRNPFPGPEGQGRRTQLCARLSVSTPIERRSALPSKRETLPPPPPREGLTLSPPPLPPPGRRDRGACCRCCYRPHFQTAQRRNLLGLTCDRGRADGVQWKWPTLRRRCPTSPPGDEYRYTCAAPNSSSSSSARSMGHSELKLRSSALKKRAPPAPDLL